MKRPLKEVMKEATPGKVAVRKAAADGMTLLWIAGHGRFALLDTMTFSRKGMLSEEGKKEAEANAILLAHAFNIVVHHEIVKKARILINLICDDESRYEAWQEEVDALNEAVAAGEQVEV
ncbi:MAG: hypothetical protein E6R03_00400 [Hyphomicrobiaceae bacterium]|nr:MAG: hypothetical protein E6R03_00400 [Hyphomicrobiaceae bacterium]